jgi:selenocysteine lyase/cysteine desulfurase
MEIPKFWLSVRDSIIGRHEEITTPFGKRRITYADYTASGRGVDFIENYLKTILGLYANTHTEDDETGKATSARLRLAEEVIKRHTGAGKQYKIIETGTGASGAIHHLQKILGIYIPPAAKVLFEENLGSFFKSEQKKALKIHLLKRRPVVFIGPFEHHSNVVTWRECYAEVVEIDLDDEGLFDLRDLEKKISKEEYRTRMKIGSFSAASNLTGVLAPVETIAKILHRHGAYAFFDYAAFAPYGRINIARDDESYFDGIFFSPHKFVGGPGSSGILIIHERVYRKDLPPTSGAGGTVDYVNFSAQEYNPDIEIREKSGTPGILQIFKAALAVQLKERMGQDEIAKREKALVIETFERFKEYPQIEIVGNRDPEKRLPIISFNIRCGDAYLHPRFVTRLLNDLFGIQSRAGCLCAGPYGHRLLGIDCDTSDRLRNLIHQGIQGLKPGWTRINFHFLITEEEYDFLCRSVIFVAEHGKVFLPLYVFDMKTGAWKWAEGENDSHGFGLDEALGRAKSGVSSAQSALAPFRLYLEEAQKTAEELKMTFSESLVRSTDRQLVPFLYYAR